MIQPTDPFQRPGASFTPNTSTPPQPEQQGVPQPVVSAPASPADSYSFITDTNPAPKRPFWSRLPGGNSLPVRMLFVSGSLVVLFMLFSVVRGAFGGGDSFAPFVTVIQEQQELIRITSGASTDPNLPANTQNFVATAQLSLGSSQSSTIQYLVRNDQKINPKILNLRISRKTDKQLEAAKASGTYPQTFQEVMDAKLKEYSKILAQTYEGYKGQKGRELLQDHYRQAQLLQMQLAGGDQIVTVAD